MKMKDAIEYVQQNAMYADDAPAKPYFVRWPTPHSSRIFFSDDTHDLVRQLYNFVNTRNMHSKHPRRTDEVC